MERSWAASFGSSAQSDMRRNGLSPKCAWTAARATRSADTIVVFLPAELLSGDLSSALAAASPPVNAPHASNVQKAWGTVEKKIVFISKIRLIGILHKAKTAMGRLWSRWTGPRSEQSA